VKTAPLLIAVLLATPPALAAVSVQGQNVEVIDAHLHAGHWGQQPASGKQFLVGALPRSLHLYAPALFEHLLDPYAAHVGIAAQTRWAGVDHAVLYAVYAQHTSGYFTNAQLIEALRDPANDGWAWGLASINLDDVTDPAVRDARIAALRSAFESAPEVLLGIKLAHAHQQVAFDDEVLLPLYDLAAELAVPVLLHTGFSPFPNASVAPSHYDPFWLRAILEAYDGAEGRPRVDFVLSHVGQGDARAMAHALELAAEYDNVWLEVSALGRPLLLDAEGEEIETSEPQLPSVLRAIHERGLVHATIFGSDGPQFSGMVRRYVSTTIDEMLAAGYELDEIRAVMAGNFRRLFLAPKRAD
jgi:uncharacterized protein